MDISRLNAVTSGYLDTYAKTQSIVQPEDSSFSSLLTAAMKQLNDTNDLQNKANEEAIRFALGQSDNMHDLLTAEAKALTAMQYTNAVKDGLLDAYKELMQMQI